MNSVVNVKSKVIDKEKLCQHCLNKGEKVKTVTLRNQLKFPLSIKPLDETYYYCSNTDCEVAYFSDDTQFLINDLQTEQQIKNKTVCFCFGITEEAFIEFVKLHGEEEFYEQLDDLAYNTKCHCKFKNPAGRGCLRKFKAMKT